MYDKFVPYAWKWFAIYSSAASALLFYVLWGPSSDSKRNKRLGGPDIKKNRSNRGSSDRFEVRGLPNPGNNMCFLNATLQAFASSTAVQIWLQKALILKKNQPLLNAITELIQYVNSNESSAGIRDAGELLAVVQSKHWVLDGDQQDVHELFHVLTNAMYEEINGEHQGMDALTPGLATNNSGNITDAVNQIRELGSDKVHRLPFHGYLASQLVCAACNSKKPVQYEPFDCLSLSLPTPSMMAEAKSCSIESCIDRLCRVETLAGVICEGCSARCHRPNTCSVFHKYTWIGKFPRCLVLHIQRSQWVPTSVAGLGGGVRVKRADSVAYTATLRLLDNLGGRHHGRIPQPTAAAAATLTHLAACGRALPPPAPRTTLTEPWRDGPASMEGSRQVATNMIPAQPVTGDHPSLLTTEKTMESQQVVGVETWRTCAEPPKLVCNHAETAVAGVGVPPVNGVISRNAYGETGMTRQTRRCHAYSLEAVISHLGCGAGGEPVSGAGGGPGHFITYRHVTGDEWYLVSDTHVTRVSLQNVLAAQAYMLFYHHR